MNENWNNNAIQFPRLIAEIEGQGTFTEELMIKLAVEMDLSQLEVAEIIDRACSEWDEIKALTLNAQTIVSTDRLKTLMADHKYMEEYRNKWMDAMTEIRKLKEANK